MRKRRARKTTTTTTTKQPRDCEQSLLQLGFGEETEEVVVCFVVVATLERSISGSS